MTEMNSLQDNNVEVIEFGEFAIGQNYLILNIHLHLPPKTQISSNKAIFTLNKTEQRNSEVIMIGACSGIFETGDQVNVIIPSKSKKSVSTNSEQLDSDQYSSTISEIENNFASELALINNEQQLEKLRVKYLSKSNGLTTLLLQSLRNMNQEDKKMYGPILNTLKKSQEEAIESKNIALTNNTTSTIDLTIPHPPRLSGRLHPTTIVIRELNEFFRSQGFSIQEGPEIETPEYNFRRLNLPEGHPATDLQDTLYIREPDLLMRTHTSSIQTRILSSFPPPMRVVVPGKVYRNENKSSTNSSFFYQYQGFVVDKGVNIQNLKEMLTRVHQFLFGKDVVLRFRYKYYPEVSPGMGVDLQCQFCHGTGCQVCKYRGWIETLGSGMTHFNCYQSCGIDPNIWSGYSFGLGLDRLVMNKFGINDIRKLYGGDLVYL